jgi:hypothetical protein
MMSVFITSYWRFATLAYAVAKLGDVYSRLWRFTVSETVKRHEVTNHPMSQMQKVRLYWGFRSYQGQ